MFEKGGFFQLIIPSPQGDLRVVILKIFVGMRTGPFTLICLSGFSFDFLINSWHTGKVQKISNQQL
jgi:hypothetical protein